MPEELIKKGHDLMAWAKHLNLSASIVGTNTAPKVRLRNGFSFGIQQAHEAWRYGVGMNQGEEAKLIAWIGHLCDWLTEENR